MENNVFKRALIVKLALGAAFLALTIGAAVGIKLVNDKLITPNEGFNHLIMARFALPAGDVTVEIENLSGKEALMPQLKGISFFSTQKLSIAQETAKE